LKKLASQGHSHIDIPDDTSPNPSHGDPTDPKTWQGPWKTLFKPDGIAQKVVEMIITKPLTLPLVQMNWQTS